MKILSLTKLKLEKDFAFITLTTKESRNDILSNSFIYHYKCLKVGITSKPVGFSTGPLVDLSSQGSGLASPQGLYFVYCYISLNLVRSSQQLVWKQQRMRGPIG
jgi:hypothetical protein